MSEKMTERLDNSPFFVWRDGDMVRVELMDGPDVAIVLLLTEKQRDGLVYRLMNPACRDDVVNGNA